MKLKSENGSAKVFFNNILTSQQSSKPFNLATQEKKLQIMSFVMILRGDNVLLQQQIQNNKIDLQIVATFKLKANWASLHYTFSLLGRYHLQIKGKS
ncbi:hypothetical protein ISN45_Aa03g028850 [Arabidopsis thaliana x Arabidopsis arenosa]|uniref:Uncharacterized protein n=1 Tax=Arabidopsis thaliana x Arabidopsis arenosa TaxID=1240361 RepID=A0A8T2AX58_9BRAS|nr:hypothetical protein ISN45_Aa03g028850 [Arabidopsis thaliana x Arabidopsis arenosa]